MFTEAEKKRVEISSNSFSMHVWIWVFQSFVIKIPRKSETAFTESKSPVGSGIIKDQAQNEYFSGCAGVLKKTWCLEISD